MEMSNSANPTKIEISRIEFLLTTSLTRDFWNLREADDDRPLVAARQDFLIIGARPVWDCNGFDVMRVS